MFDIQRVLIFEQSLSTQIMEVLGRFHTYGQACDEWLCRLDDMNEKLQ